MGDAVDTWNDGGWWVGRVTSVPVASAGVATASPRRGSGRRKDHGPPAAQPPLRILLAGSGEDLQAQQVRMQLEVQPCHSLWLSYAFPAQPLCF